MLAAGSLAAVGLLVAGTLIVPWVREQVAVRALVETIESTPDGQSVDLAKAFDLPWDQAVLVGPYASGQDANQVLGLDGLDANAMLNSDDSGANLIFASGTSVVANLQLPWAGFSFDVDPYNFTPLRITPRGATFTVLHQGRWPLLRVPVTP